jgi:hypothetical protein
MSDRIPVIFRTWRAKGERYDREVIAIFPTLPGSYHPYTCTAFSSVGQHSACDPHSIVERSRPATRQEYRALRRELESQPYRYRLRVVKRLHPAYTAARRRALGGDA